MVKARTSRDKQGIDTVVLTVHDPERARPRVIYLYRSVPGLKVGRAPLDDDTTAELEARFPDVTFDWPRLTRAVASAVVPPSPLQTRRQAPGPPPEAQDADAREPRARGRGPSRRDAPVAVPREVRRADAGGEGLERLRERHRAIVMRIHQRATEPGVRDRLLADAAAIDPDRLAANGGLDAARVAFEAGLMRLQSRLPRKKSRPAPAARADDAVEAPAPGAGEIRSDEEVGDGAI